MKKYLLVGLLALVLGAPSVYATLTAPALQDTGSSISAPSIVSLSSRILALEAQVKDLSDKYQKLVGASVKATAKETKACKLLRESYESSKKSADSAESEWRNRYITRDRSTNMTNKAQDLLKIKTEGESKVAGLMNDMNATAEKHLALCSGI